VTERELSAWLDAYGDAFERQDPAAAAALFTPDASYQWGPFGERLQGTDAIRAKWAESTDPREASVTFGHEVLAVTDTIGIARWLASYTYPQERKILRFDGIFAVALSAEGLCHDFREWWNTREEPLEAPS
jgi:hypothetical protein